MKRPFWILFLLVAILVLVVNEWLSVRQNESAFRQVMDRQANAILFSINQNCWDLTSSWSDAWSRQLRKLAAGDTSGQADFLSANPTVDQWWFEHADGSVVIYSTGRHGISPDSLKRILSNQRVQKAELVSLLENGYRKLEPVESLPDGMQGLLGVTEIEAGTYVRSGFLYHGTDFIVNRVAPMLDAASGEGLSIGVFSETKDSLLVANQAFIPSPDDPRNRLWIFPDAWLVLNLQNDQYDAMVDGRFRRSGFMLTVALVLLGLGLMLVYRSVRRQTQLAQMKTDFVANVSHELRTPLSLIRMFAETLQMGRVSDEEKRLEYYRIIGSESERLGYMINNILDFSRMEAGEKQFRMETVSLNEIVRSVMETYRYTLEARQFEWEVALDADDPAITADRDAVVEVCINLLENAIKYSADAKFVRVQTKSLPQGIELSVEDRGIGIPKEHQKRIFDLFFRVESSLTAKTRGSGLGLSIVKRIADAHGAEIEVDSEEGKGSRFTLIFPQKEATP